MFQNNHRLLGAVFIAGVLSMPAYVVADSSAEKNWASWLLSEINQLPEVKSLENKNNAAIWSYEAGNKPIYNPEIGAAYDNNQSNEFSVSINQTFDFSGKQDAQLNKSSAELAFIELESRQQKEVILTSILRALVNFEKTRSFLEQAKSQDNIFNDLHEIIIQRKNAGDVSALDEKLTILSMSENIQKIAALEAEYNKASAELEAVLGSKEALFPFPEISKKLEFVDIDQLALSSLQYLSAHKKLSLAKADIQLTRANQKSDPTFGFSATSNDDENYVGLSISFPLNVRNNYQSEYMSASEKYLQAELELQAVQREVKSHLREKVDNFQSQLKYWKRWDSLKSSSVVNNENLAEQQWAIGDIPTSEYLFALQQQGMSEFAGIELESSLKQAWIDWLYLTQNTEVWLNTLADKYKGPEKIEEIGNE